MSSIKQHFQHDLTKIYPNFRRFTQRFDPLGLMFQTKGCGVTVVDEGATLQNAIVLGCEGKMSSVEMNE